MQGSLRDSHVNFAVEKFSTEVLHPDQIVTYNRKLADSHDAFDLTTGFFTAPVHGTYTFFFRAGLRCDLAWARRLYALKNQEKSEIKFCWVTSSVSFDTDPTIFFTYQLNTGDQVGINSGDFNVRYYIKFSGFLLPSF